MPSRKVVLYRILHTLFAFSVIITAMLGCSNGDSGASDESPVEIIRTGSSPKYEGPLFSLEHDLTLGIDEGEPEWQIFGRMIMPEIANNGLIYLMNMPGYIVSIVSPDGDLLGQFGGQGSGPGEFAMPTRMFWIESNQELWVNDGRLYRVTRFTSDGDLIDTISYTKHSQDWDQIQYLGEGTFLGHKYDMTTSRTDPVFHYGFLDEDFSWQRDFISLPGQRNVQASERSWIPLPFSGMPRVVCTPDGRIVIGRPYERRLYFYDREGNLNLTIEHDWELPKVSEESKRNWIERTRSRTSLVDPSYFEKVELPDRQPAFVNLTIDDKSRVWVRRSRSGPVTEPIIYIYDIFSTDGDWLGSQSLDFSPFKIQNGYIYRNINSQDHGPRFVRYKLHVLHPELGE